MDERKITTKEVREGRLAALLATLPELAAKYGRPATLRELATALGLGENRISSIRNDLQALEQAGKVRPVQVAYGYRRAYEVVDEQAEAVG